MTAAVSRQNQVTAEELVERARALAVRLDERSAATEAARQLPAETIAEMQEAGLFRVLQPTRWGGYAMDPMVFFRCQMEMAKACPSTAWVYGVVAVHNWQLALFDDRAQQEVWGEDSSTLISSSYMPVGKVQHTEGGYLLSGRWGFSSGSDHCDWVFLGAFVPPREEGQQPDMRTFLVPRRDYRLDDTWHTSGLRGTGSKDVVIDEPVFVPEYRTHRFADGFRLKSPGNTLNPEPLFRLPFGQLFVRSVSTSTIGMLEGATDRFIAGQRERVARGDGRKVQDDPSTQAAIAEARATVHDLRTVLAHNMATLMAYAEANEDIPVDLRVAYRYDSARVVEKCRRAMLDLFAAAGGGAIFESHPLQRYFQAINAARAHYANNPEKPGINFARVSMGLRTTDYFI